MVFFTHTHAHAHTEIHTHANTQTHTHIHNHIHHTHAPTPTPTHAHTHATHGILVSFGPCPYTQLYTLSIHLTHALAHVYTHVVTLSKRNIVAHQKCVHMFAHSLETKILYSHKEHRPYTCTSINKTYVPHITPSLIWPCPYT